MSDVLNIVPVSSPTRYSVTSLQSDEKGRCQVQQLLSQAMSSITLGQTEVRPALNPGKGREYSHKLEKLQVELETLKLFGAGIAHDFGNILTIIVANLELIRLWQPDSKLSPAFEELEEAVKMAKALNIQLHQLFQGTTRVRESVELGTLVEEATRLGLFGAVGVECHFNLSSDLPPVQVDPCQISQVIENLVLNAVQAMPNGGRLEVAAEVVELTQGQLSPLGAGRYIEIKVSDSGVGICPEHLNVVFAPHFTTKAQGQGLGLALCYTIIQRHQGHIRVESQPDSGTTFRVWLPLTSTELSVRRFPFLIN